MHHVAQEVGLLHCLLAVVDGNVREHVQLEHFLGLLEAVDLQRTSPLAPLGDEVQGLLGGLDRP